MITAYKCFNKGLTNRYGTKFKTGTLYHQEGEISFGNNGNGFHACLRLEDTLRYFDAMTGEVDICLVNLSGKIVEYEDDYNGYYDMYAAENMEIVKVLNHDEIINYGLNLYEMRAIRFISLYHLNDKEINMFKARFANNINVLNNIAYYQEGDITVFDRQYSKKR